MDRTLTWLHLSDFPFGPSRLGQGSGSFADALLHDLENLASRNGLCPDFVFCTGDVALGHLHGPSRSEFDQLQGLFDSVRQIFNLPRDHVFLVPGNHDVDRRGVLDTGLGIPRAAERMPWHVDDVEPRVFARGMQGLRQYREFLEHNGYSHLLQAPDDLTFSALRQVRGLRVGIVGLNSAWPCGVDCKRGTIRSGADKQALTCLDQLRRHNPDLCVALMHHPTSWLQEREAVSLEATLDAECAFFLHGHDHDSWASIRPGGCCRISNASVHSPDGAGQSYNVVRISPDSRQGEAWLRRYRDGAWTSVTGAGAGTGHGESWPLHNLTWRERRSTSRAIRDPNESVDVVVLSATHVEHEALVQHIGSAEVARSTEQIYRRVRLNGRTVAIVAPTHALGNEGVVSIRRVIHTLQPEYVISVGLAAGVAHDGHQSLGDVVVAEQFVDCDTGRQVADSALRRFEVFRPAAPLLSAARIVAARDWKSTILAEPPSPQSRRSATQVHFGSIGSVTQVIKSPETLHELTNRFAALAAIEMEGAGIFAATSGAEHPPGVLLVRSICDWADGAKDGSWRQYAAASAAAFVAATLEALGPKDARDTQQGVSSVELTLECPVADFDKEKFLAALAATVGVDTSKVRIVSVKRGSTVLKLQASDDELERIIRCFRDSQMALHQFMNQTGMSRAAWILDGQRYELRVETVEQTGGGEEKAPLHDLGSGEIAQTQCPNPAHADGSMSPGAITDVRLGAGNADELDAATIGILTALPKECAAVEAVFGPTVVKAAEGEGGGRSYSVARLASTFGGEHVLAIALLPDAGNCSAATRATKLLGHCPRVRHLVMVGIAGAVPNPGNAEHHVRLGDIVVSDRNGVVQYRYEKLSDSFAELRSPPRPPGAALTDAVRSLQKSEVFGQRSWEKHIERAVSTIGDSAMRPPVGADRLHEWNEGWTKTAHPKDPLRRKGLPRVFFGPIASADVLLKRTSLRDSLRDKHKVKAVEMEGAGVADASWLDAAGYLVVRGTCDYCNKDKGDSWQLYAAIIAAAYARSVIECMPVESVPRH